MTPPLTTPATIRRRLTRNLPALRHRRGQTQAQAAAALGIGRSRYASYEEGCAQPPLSLCLALCQLHGCTLDALLTTAL